MSLQALALLEIGVATREREYMYKCFGFFPNYYLFNATTT